MKGSVWLASLSFFFTSSFAQQISKQEADSLLSVLEKSETDLHRIDLLLTLAQYHIFKPGENQIDFDSAASYIKAANDLNRSVKSSEANGFALLTESYMCREKKEMAEGKKIAERAVGLLETSSNKDYLGKAYYELSMYLDWQDPEQLKQRIRLVEKAVDVFKIAGVMGKNAYTLEMLGDLYGLNNEQFKAITVLEQALVAYQATGNDKIQGVFILLGQALFAVSRESEGLSYMLKALKIAKVQGDTSMRLCQINNIIGLLYLRIDRKEASIAYFKDALETARKYRDEETILFIISNMAISFNFLNRPSQALKILASIPRQHLLNANGGVRRNVYAAFLKSYLALKQYDNAKPYADMLLKTVGEETSALQRSGIYNVLGAYYLQTKQFAKARTVIQKSFVNIQEKNRPRQILEALEVTYKLDSAAGNFRDAFRNFQLYKIKRDSLFARNREQQLQVLGVEYEVSMKEDSIKLRDQDIALLTQANHLQQANLKQASLIKNVTIAGIILALVIAGLFYRQYWIKQKNSEIISQKNEQLQHLVNEKDWLLKEIHHRVKNNLQIVMSLLNSQSAFINNPDALSAIHDSQHRVQAMSLIHQKLYGSESVSSIDMSNYVRDLVSYLADSFNTGGRIRFQYNVEPIELDVSQAVPLGLILNEAITNAIKYAFHDSRNGIISILFFTKSSGEYVLQIADDGIGIPSHFNMKKPGSLGMSLIAGLAEDLNGHFSIKNDNGTVIIVNFAPELSIKRHGAETSTLVSGI